MKRYLIFSFATGDYSRTGGWDDFVIDVSEIKEAKKIAYNEVEKSNEYLKAHIVDIESMEKIYET